MNYKSVLITGASSGIGRELAKQLSPNLNYALLCGRNSEELKVTEEVILKTNPNVKVEHFVGDLTQNQDRQRLIDFSNGKCLDLVLLNAGGGDFDLFKNSSWSSSEKTIALNIEAPVHLSHALIPQLLNTAEQQNHKSALVIISSHAGFMHIPHFAVYASCKSFLNDFSQTLAQEYNDQPIDIMVSCPGATRTKFSKRAGLPTKMLSTPAEPELVARRTLKAIGSTRFYIVMGFDRILYLAQKFLPTWFFDRVVAHMQRGLLKQARPTSDNENELKRQEGA